MCPEPALNDATPVKISAPSNDQHPSNCPSNIAKRNGVSEAVKSRTFGTLQTASGYEFMLISPRSQGHRWPVTSFFPHHGVGSWRESRVMRVPDPPIKAARASSSTQSNPNPQVTSSEGGVSTGVSCLPTPETALPELMDRLWGSALSAGHSLRWSAARVMSPSAPSINSVSHRGRIR